MLKYLVLRNFRGIRETRLSQLSVVNILVGRNGCGKTTVLEGVGVAGNPSRPAFLSALSGWRELPPWSLDSDHGVRSFFMDLDSRVNPFVEFEDEEGRHSISIRASDEVTSSQSAANGDGQSIGAGQTGVITRLEFEYSSRPGENLRSTATLERLASAPPFGLPGIAVSLREHPNAGVKGLGAFYIHARRSTSASETAKMLTRIYEQKQEHLLMEFIRQVDPRVQRMQPGVSGNQPLILVDVGGDRMLPMNLLGDGFCRVSLIATGLAFGGTRLLVVDEIDSGLHHSVMAEFWRSLAASARHFGCQVFCATHNEEMLSQAVPAFASCREDLRVFRLERLADGTVEAHALGYSMLEAADQTGLEVR